MFNIGDHIIYPLYGAGVIEAIEDIEIQGQTQKYYVIKILMNKMQVLFPHKTITNSQIRPVADKLSIENVLEIFHHGESDISLSWKERYNINSAKLKSGKLIEGAEVVRDLMRLQNKKILNPTERKMLESAKGIFVSELRITRGISETQAADLLNSDKSG